MVKTTAFVALIFMNEEDVVQSIDYLSGFGIRDHACVLFNASKWQTQPKFTNHKDNCISVNYHLNTVHWSPMDNMTVHEAWIFIYIIYENRMTVKLHTNIGQAWSKSIQTAYELLR